MFIRRATIFDFFPPFKLLSFPSFYIARSVESFLRNNNNDYVFRRRLFNGTKRLHSRYFNAIFQCKKKKKRKKKLNRRKNERIRNTMKELFYLEAKRGKRDQRGTVKSNFDKFKSNLNDRLQFCSKTKGEGRRVKKKKKKEWKGWFYLSREDYGVRKRKVLRRLLTDRYWFPVKSTGTVTEATSGSDNFHWNIRANLFLVNINDNIYIYKTYN